MQHLDKLSVSDFNNVTVNTEQPLKDLIMKNNLIIILLIAAPCALLAKAKSPKKVIVAPQPALTTSSSIITADKLEVEIHASLLDLLKTKNWTLAIISGPGRKAFDQHKTAIKNKLLLSMQRTQRTHVTKADITAAVEKIHKTLLMQIEHTLLMHWLHAEVKSSKHPAHRGHSVMGTDEHSETLRQVLAHNFK
jgi:hypothetical protein